ALFQAAIAEARPGVRLECVSTVSACLERCRSLRRDHRVVAFVDMKLVGETGNDAIRGIRADQRVAQVPIVMLSSSRRDDDISSALMCGANAFMTKPFSFGTLVDQLRVASAFWFDGHRHPSSVVRAGSEGEN
ncbi:MAG: response regulator, partial [Planctomycetota bacterium]